MHGWLNMHAGRGNFAIHSAPNDLPVDAALVYFMEQWPERSLRGSLAGSRSFSVWS